MKQINGKSPMNLTRCLKGLKFEIESIEYGLREDNINLKKYPEYKIKLEENLQCLKYAVEILEKFLNQNLY